MPYSASVINGEIQASASAQSMAKETKVTGGKSLDKDAFLQLLVAEMKYQDPMEASNNSTEYISQLATFSSLEGMQNLEATADDMKLNNLIGKTVVLNVDDKFISGQVDYVQQESGKTYISVNGDLYSADNIYQIIDSDYMAAYEKASQLVDSIKKLPGMEYLNEEDIAKVQAISEKYGAMNGYEQSFVAEDAVKILKNYEEAISAMIKKQEENAEQKEAPAKDQSEESKLTDAE